jgi:hypothetical protein
LQADEALRSSARLRSALAGGFYVFKHEYVLLF